MKMQEKAKTVEIYSPKIRLPKHGYTKIELKDPYTCRKQVFESENMVTKGVEEYFANMGVLNNYEDDFRGGKNLVQALLGGVWLFDDEITENVNNYGIPAANMTANMAVGVTNNTNPSELGSYSSTESGWAQDGSYVQVYDFTTTQGNGDIASACLTSQRAGVIGCGNRSDTNKNAGYDAIGNFGSAYQLQNVTAKVMFKLDYANSYGYAYDAYEIYNGTFKTTGKIHIYKYLVPMNKIDVRGTQLVDTIEISCGTVSLDRFDEKICDGKLIITGIEHYSQQWTSSNPVHVFVVDENGSNHYTVNPPDSGLYYNYYSYGYVFDGCLYTLKATGTGTSNFDASTIYKLRLSDSAIVKTITGVVGNAYNTWNSPYYWVGDKQVITYGMLFMNFETDSFHLCNGRNQDSPERYWGKVVGKNMKIRNAFSTYSSTITAYPMFVRNTWYAASINNLDSTVTKTPDKTMKVTYRITF